ncbi:MAG: ATP-binding cassette domain-containing protein [Planctomycetes bacterium]|nr:ATP-binding cassette domain-containing protein [Planctomycetota bacterium]
MHVTCSNLHKSFGELQILNDFSCDIENGSSYALLGPSGSGKSTLLNIFSGLDIPDNGSVTHNQTSIHDKNHHWREQWRLQHIGILRQDPLLDHGLTARENVLLPALFHNISEAETQAADLLERLGLQAHADKKCRYLSSGQHMRIALARCLMGKAQLLIVDEPTGTLDNHNAMALGKILHDVRQAYNCTLIIATHDQDIAQQCDQCFEFTAPDALIAMNDTE